jgi:general secretion pathway protein J
MKSSKIQHPSPREAPNSKLQRRRCLEIGVWGFSGAWSLEPGVSSRRAFTLIEMILAIGVCSIVVLAINTAFFSALRLREHTTAVVEEALPVQQALVTMRRDLQCAMQPGGVMSGDFKVGGVTSLGSGESVAIEFCTATGALRENEPWGDVQRVTYQLRQRMGSDSSGGDLIRSVTRNLLATLSSAPDEQRLMGNVESLEFTCYDGSQWLDTWDTSLTTTNLPVAVRVRIQLATENTGNARDQQPVEIVVPISSQLRTNQFQATGGAG